jgi:exonuclease III
MSGNPNSIYLPGGTAIFVKHTLAQHITKRITDHVGQWCGIILKISRNSVAVFSIYLPPKNQSCKGTVNITTQQSWWLVDNGSKHSVHTQYKHDLLNLIPELQRDGHHMLIAGDFNKHTTEGGLLHSF